MSSHIKPSSVNSYLSRICNQLKPFFPNVQKSCNSMLMSRTMTGCQCCFGTPVKHKCPLSTDDLKTVISVIGTSPQHDNKLFLAMLLTRFHGLMHLGELTFPNSVTHHDYHKVILRHTVDVTNRSYSFCCLAIRPTALMREILLLLNEPNYQLAPTVSSNHISLPEITFTPSSPNSGCVSLVFYQPVPGSSSSSVIFSLLI